MVKNEGFNQSEELSQYLDALNDGSYPVVQDKEMQELVKVASFAKQAYNQQDFPQLMIDNMVNNLSAELRAQKQKRRRKWLYSGFAAAAVLLITSAQLLWPHSPKLDVAQQSELTNHKEAIVDEANDAAKSLQNDSVQSADVDTSTGQAVLPQEAKPVEVAAQLLAEIVQGAEAPDTQQNSNQVAMISRETAKEIPEKRNALMSVRNIETKSLGSQNERRTAIMVLPNQTASSIKVDNASGIIQQVYNQGTADEITITQKPVRSLAAASEKDVAQVRNIQQHNQISDQLKDGNNQITIKKDQYYITVAGNKTKEELEKTAESMVIRDVEQ